MQRLNEVPASFIQCVWSSKSYSDWGLQVRRPVGTCLSAHPSWGWPEVEGWGEKGSPPRTDGGEVIDSRRAMLEGEARGCDEIGWRRRQLFPCEDRLTEGLSEKSSLFIFSVRLSAYYLKRAADLCDSSSVPPPAHTVSFPSQFNLADVALVPPLALPAPLDRVPPNSLLSYSSWPFPADDKL